MILKTLAVTWSAMIVVACGGGDGEGDTSLTASDGSAGTVTLEMGDAPVDNLTAVNLTITAIEFGGDDGSTSDIASDTFEVPFPQEFNLLDYQNGEYFTLFDSVKVDSGDYAWVRLILDPNNPPEVVEQDGDRFTLSIPSGAQTGLKLSGSGTFLVTGNDTHHYAIDLDLHRSLKQTGNGTYKLKPSYRLVDLDANTWTLSGSIGLTPPVGCNGAIYVYRGNVIADDIENPDDGTTISGTDTADSVEPYIVKVIGSTRVYSIENLSTGTYTVAYTCDVEADSPDEDNDSQVDFLGSKSVTVSGDMSNIVID